jgi:predicted transcriptional regulator
MPTDYERAIDEFMPAFRAAASRIMINKYKISQQKAAELLNMTQASISKYINGRYSNSVKDIELGIKDNDVEVFVKYMINKYDRDAQRQMCSACQRYHGFDCAIMVK